MRRKKEAVLCFESNDDGLPKVVRDYRERYRAISQVLDDNPKILAAIHRDILKLSEGDSQGREGDYTSENILRALVVQHLEGLPFRDAVIRIGFTIGRSSGCIFTSPATCRASRILVSGK